MRHLAIVPFLVLLAPPVGLAAQSWQMQGYVGPKRHYVSEMPEDPMFQKPLDEMVVQISVADEKGRSVTGLTIANFRGHAVSCDETSCATVVLSLFRGLDPSPETAPGFYRLHFRAEKILNLGPVLVRVFSGVTPADIAANVGGGALTNRQKGQILLR